jgi:putative nucleotidyltransferase with HDIG domain
MSAGCVEVLSKVKDLQTIPGATTALLQLLNDPTSSTGAITGEVRKDQGLMALVLRTANSSLYGSAGQVRDITEAVIVLGFDTLRQLVLARLARTALRRNDPVQRALWRHALATAVAAEACARAVRGITVAHAFTGGLLHDIGKAVLSEGSPEAYARVWEIQSRDERPSDEIEREHFGTDHAEVGAALLKSWQFPPLYQHAVRFHHAPASATGGGDKEQRLLSIAVLSDAVSAWVGHGPRPARPIAEFEGHPMLDVLGSGTHLVVMMEAHLQAQLTTLSGVFS